MSVTTVKVRVALKPGMTCLEAKGQAYLNFTPRYTAAFVKELIAAMQKDGATVSIRRADGTGLDVPWSTPVRDALDLPDDATYATVLIDVLDSDLAEHNKAASGDGEAGGASINLSKHLSVAALQGTGAGATAETEDAAAKGDGGGNTAKYHSYPKVFTVTKPMSNLEFSNLVDMGLGMTEEQANRDNVKPENRVQPTDFEVTQEILDRGNGAGPGKLVVLIIDESRPVMDDETVVDAEEFIKGLPEDQLKALNDKTDALFWEKSGYKPGEKLVKGDPRFEQMAAAWLEFRRELADVQNQVAGLPERLRAFLPIGEDGIPLTAENIGEIMRLADKLKDVSDAELAEFWDRTNAKTMDVTKFVDSVERYLARLEERKEATDKREEAERALYGKEELYRIWDLANEKKRPEVYRVRNEPFPSPENVAYNKTIDKAKADLPALLEKYGYASEAAFAAEVKAYANSFRDEAIAIAQDSLDKRDHEIFDFRDEHVSPESTSGMFDALAEAREYHVARSMGWGDEGLVKDLTPYIEEAARKDPHLAALLDFFRKEDPKGAIPEEVVELLVKEDNLTDFREELQEMLDDRDEAIDEMRGNLTEKDKIWSLDAAMGEARARAGVANDGLMLDDILDEATDEATKWDWVGEVALGVAAVIAGLVSGGTGTVAILAGAAALGLGVYGAWDTIDEYNEDQAAYLSGLASSRPSIVWVVISLATLPLDVLGLGSAIRGTIKAGGAIAKVSKITHIAAILDEGHDVGKAVRGFDDAAKTVKTAEEAVDEVKRLDDILKKIEVEGVPLPDELRHAIVKGATQHLDEALALAKLAPEPMNLAKATSGEIAGKIEFAVFRQKARGTGDFKAFMESADAKAIVGSADDLKASPESLAKVKEAYAAAEKEAESLIDTARGMGLSDDDLEVAMEYWARHPDMTRDELLSGVIKPMSSYGPPLKWPKRTKPTGKKGDVPTGRRLEAKEGDLAATKHEILRDNESADALADSGYKVELNPGKRPNGRKPDYKIEGEWADNLAPKPNTDPFNICSQISKKLGASREAMAVVPDRIQAQRIVLNLNDWKGSIDELREAAQAWRLNKTGPTLEQLGLEEILVVKDGLVFPL